MVIATLLYWVLMGLNRTTRPTIGCSTNFVRTFVTTKKFRALPFLISNIIMLSIRILHTMTTVPTVTRMGRDIIVEETDADNKTKTQDT